MTLWALALFFRIQNLLRKCWSQNRLATDIYSYLCHVLLFLSTAETQLENSLVNFNGNQPLPYLSHYLRTIRLLLTRQKMPFPSAESSTPAVLTSEDTHMGNMRLGASHVAIAQQEAYDSICCLTVRTTIEIPAEVDVPTMQMPMPIKSSSRSIQPRLPPRSPARPSYVAVLKEIAKSEVKGDRISLQGSHAHQTADCISLGTRRKSQAAEFSHVDDERFFDEPQRHHFADSSRMSPSNYSSSIPVTPSPWTSEDRQAYLRDFENMVEEQHFALAAIEVFADLDVDAIIEEPGFELEDHDPLKGVPKMNLLPHPPKLTCHCHWCHVDRNPELQNAQEHDPNVWCNC